MQFEPCEAVPDTTTAILKTIEIRATIQTTNAIILRISAICALFCASLKSPLASARRACIGGNHPNNDKSVKSNNGYNIQDVCTSY